METSLYRIVSGIEMREISAAARIETTRKRWKPYSRNEVVFLFESDDVLRLFERYAGQLADLRGVRLDHEMYALRIMDPPGRVEVDRSVNGWPESRAHFGDIPIQCVCRVGVASVTRANPGLYVVDPLKVCRPAPQP